MFTQIETEIKLVTEIIPNVESSKNNESQVNATANKTYSFLGIENFNHVLKESQNAVSDTKNLGLYSEGAHSATHIQNVILFSQIIAKQRGLSEDDIKLLTEAAKFHDSGRKDDSALPHAKPGAQIAKRVMQARGYDNDSIDIVQAAILFHEEKPNKKKEFPDKKVPEKGSQDELLMMQFFDENYGIKGQENLRKVIEISMILKDADALDRTRFVDGRATLDSNQLRTTEAKNPELINFAKAMNEEYARQDLDEYIKQNQGLDSEEIAEYKSMRTSMHTMRDIRKGVFIPRQKLDEVMTQKAEELTVNEVQDAYQAIKDSKKELEATGKEAPTNSERAQGTIPEEKIESLAKSVSEIRANQAYQVVKHDLQSTVDKVVEDMSGEAR